MSCRLGVDVGGTFTDLLLLDDATGAVHLLKTPSTPADPSVGILTGIEELLSQSGIAPQQITTLLHGTTVTTNIVLEQKGAKVGLLVTENFEQILHLARSQTPGPLAGWIIMVKPDPLADLEHTRGITERITARGDIVKPLDEAQARQAIQDLIDAGVESITVSLLHSYANPAHEVRLKDLIREAAPETPISISSELLPEFREYERTLVTVMNAYVRPSMRRYLESFENKLHGIQIAPSVSIVRSDGGLMSVQRASESPVKTLLSGPAGGVSGAAFLAAMADHPDALGFDMGGTSTDVSLILDGKPVISRQTALGYYPIKVPSVDVRSVGAGGGSIAHVPMTGALRVGPESAGADPGPACYGRGGEHPTVTDANVLLGRLPPSLLGGAMRLDVNAAEDAIAKIAAALGLDTFQAAQGMLDIVNENMLGALRLVSVQKGFDPRDFALVAFGGAGPLHGNAMAMLAGCYPVIVPPTPGVLSALGFVYSDVKNEFTRTYTRTIGEVDAGQVGELLTGLGREARSWLGEERIDEAHQEIRYEADVRYLRQGYELALEVEPQAMANGGLADIENRFGLAHERLYGFRLAQPIEIVNLRAVGTGRTRKAEPKAFEDAGPSAREAAVEQHQVYFDGGFVSAIVYHRAKLHCGNRVPGPAVITQWDSTTLIHPGHVGIVDKRMNIMIYAEGAAPAGGAVS